MPDTPEEAVKAAAEAIDHEMRSTAGMRGDTAFAYDAARVALAAIAPLIRAEERERVRRHIAPAKLRLLADWFDIDDELKAGQFPTCDIERGSDVQADLRRWADLLEDGNG